MYTFWTDASEWLEVDFIKMGKIEEEQVLWQEIENCL